MTGGEEKVKCRKEKKARKKQLKKQRQGKVDEYRRLREEMRASKSSAVVVTGNAADARASAEMSEDLISAVEQRRRKFVKRKRTFGDRENATLARLAMFKTKLSAAKQETGGGPDGRRGYPTGHDDADKCGRDKFSRAPAPDKALDDDDGLDWMATDLKFVRHIDDELRTGGMLGSQGPGADDGLITVDPRRGDVMPDRRARSKKSGDHGCSGPDRRDISRRGDGGACRR